MSALIPSSECARVFSILGTRPFRNAGAGFSSGRFDPRHIAGCAALYCTNTAAFPGAVGFPADPLVNGNFEGAAGPPPNGWTATNCTGTREAGARTGGSGSYVGQAAWDTVNVSGLLLQNGKLTVGNRYLFEGWLQTGGGGIVQVDDGVSLIHAPGVPLADWTKYSVPFTATGSAFCLRSNNFAAGRWFKADDVTVTPLNANQLTELTGNGRHLVQAAAASQPLWVASGSGGVLRHDGTADFMATAAFGLVQPCHYFVGAKFPVASATLIDGTAAANKGRIYRNADNDTYIHAGSGGMNVTAAGANWHMFDAVFNGAASKNAADNGVQAVGDAGAGNPDGLRICASVGGVGYSASDVAFVAVFNRELAAPDRARMYRWWLRQKAMLAL